MKKFLSMLLGLLLILSGLLISCEDKGEDENSREQENSDGSEQAETLEKSILDGVIFLMNDDTYDPDDVISKFFGDFMIDGFNSTDLPYKRIYKIGDVMAYEYSNGDVDYQIVSEHKIHTVQKFANTNECCHPLLEEYPYDYPLSIFSVFGIDMSMIYSTEEVDSDKMPVASYDALILSDDCKSVTFSDAYLKDLGRYICDVFELDEAGMDKFVDSMSAGGGYSVSDQTFTFVIEGTMEGLGTLRVDMEMSYTGKKPSAAKTCMTLATEMDGLPIIVTQESEIKDMIYDKDDKLISLRYINRNLEECKYSYEGESVDYSFSVIEDHVFTLENSFPKEFQIMIETEELMSASGETQTSTSAVTFVLTPTFLSYSASVDGQAVGHIIANSVTLTTPDNLTIPEEVLAVMPK